MEEIKKWTDPHFNNYPSCSWGFVATSCLWMYQRMQGKLRLQKIRNQLLDILQGMSRSRLRKCNSWNNWRGRFGGHRYGAGLWKWRLKMYYIFRYLFINKLICFKTPDKKKLFQIKTVVKFYENFLKNNCRSMFRKLLGFLK